MVLVAVALAVGVGVSRPAVGQGGGGGQDQSAGDDPLGADQAVGQVAHRPRRAAEQDDLQAAVGVEVDVGRRHHPVEVAVLELGQPLGDPAGTASLRLG